jgi:hypothetical protein
MQVPSTVDVAGRSLDSHFGTSLHAQQDAMFMLWQHALIAQRNQLLMHQCEKFEVLRSRLLAIVGAPPGLGDVVDSPPMCKVNAGQACWDQSTICSSSQRSNSPGASSAGREQCLIVSEQHELTTMIIRNLVDHCTREMLTTFMDCHGFNGKYNLLYLPRCFASQRCFHYAFVNFISEEMAADFQAGIHGVADRELFGESVADVSLSQCQGLQANIAKYRNSSVMHHSVPDDCKPLMFQNGNPIAFPKPTKRIKADRRLRRERIDGVPGLMESESP